MTRTSLGEVLLLQIAVDGVRHREHIRAVDGSCPGAHRHGVHLLERQERDAVLDVLRVVLRLRIGLLDERLHQFGALAADLRCGEGEEHAEHRHGDSDERAEPVLPAVHAARVPLVVVVPAVLDVLGMLQCLVC
jgi:hypothetical protein